MVFLLCFFFSVYTYATISVTPTEEGVTYYAQQIDPKIFQLTSFSHDQQLCPAIKYLDKGTSIFVPQKVSYKAFNTFMHYILNYKGIHLSVDAPTTYDLPSKRPCAFFVDKKSRTFKAYNPTLLISVYELTERALVKAAQLISSYHKHFSKVRIFSLLNGASQDTPPLLQIAKTISATLGVQSCTFILEKIDFHFIITVAPQTHALSLAQARIFLAGHPLSLSGERISPQYLFTHMHSKNITNIDVILPPAEDYMRSFYCSINNGMLLQKSYPNFVQSIQQAEWSASDQYIEEATVESPTSDTCLIIFSAQKCDSLIRDLSKAYKRVETVVYKKLLLIPGATLDEGTLLSQTDTSMGLADYVQIQSNPVTEEGEIAMLTSGIKRALSWVF